MTRDPVPVREGSDAGGPGLLAGIRVIDLTNVLAGPFASYQLALMGADVVKVEVPGSGDLARQLGADPDLNGRGIGSSFLAQNSGKRSIALDLKSDSGTRALAALLADADVLVENFRPGVLHRLGFGWPTLHERNPRLVYCAISGFGASGPMTDRPAYDQVVQGLSGMMSVTGTAETAPLRIGFPVCDTFGGMTAAFAICAALQAVARGAEGVFLDVSMLETAVTALGWVASDYLVAGRKPGPMGNENPTAAPSGTFRTGDGYLNIAANQQEQFETLCGLVGRGDLSSDLRFAGREARITNRKALRDALEIALSSRPADEWEAVLAGAGVPAARVLSVPEALALEQIGERGLVSAVPVPGQPDRLVDVLGCGVRVNGRPVRPSGPSPRLGEHAAEILQEVGLDAEDIRQLGLPGAPGQADGR